MNKEEFENIPKTRGDEECPKCGGGTLNATNLFRRVDLNHTQSVWICSGCGADVVTLDEDNSEDCPLCGSPGQFTKTQIEEMEEDRID